jgi:hypothetical protein
MNILLVLQFLGGLLNLLAKNSLKNKKVAGWYFQGIGTLSYFFVFLIIKDNLYQVFSIGLFLLTVYGAYKFYIEIKEETKIDDCIRYGTLLFMAILLVLKIKDNPYDYLAITQMIASICLMLGLRYLTVKDIKGWLLVVTSSVLLVAVFFLKGLFIMMSFQIISTFISIGGYLKYKKALS